jgi:RimJ/RimL family protein N-acetyltransferase
MDGIVTQVFTEIGPDPEMAHPSRVAILEEGGQEVGRISVANTPDGAWIYDNSHAGTNPHGSARLMLWARKAAKEFGATTLYCHIKPDNQRMAEALMKYGMELDCIVLKGAL